MSEYLQLARDGQLATPTGRVLTERGAEVPVQETEEEVDERSKFNSKLSTMKAGFVVIYLVILALFSTSTVKFLLFTATLLGVLKYLNDKKKV